MGEFMFENSGRFENRRWYDDVTNVSLALSLSQQMPVEIQTLIAKNLNEYIDSYRQLKRNDKNAVSMGTTRALGLYKASSRQRWYDSQPSLHRAYSLMSTVPDFFLQEYANRVINVATYMEQQKAMFHYSHPMEMVDTVQTMLSANLVNFMDDKGDIRLVVGKQEPAEERRRRGPDSKVRHPHRPPHR